MKSKRMTFCIPDEMNRDLTAIAKQRGCTKADVIRFAILTHNMAQEIINGKNKDLNKEENK